MLMSRGEAQIFLNDWQLHVSTPGAYRSATILTGEGEERVKRISVGHNSTSEERDEATRKLLLECAEELSDCLSRPRK